MAPFCGILGKKEAVDMVLWLGEGDASVSYTHLTLPTN